MLSMFVLMGIFPEAGTYIMLPVMFGVCLLPQFLRTSFMKKWAVFKEETQGRVIEAQKTNIADLKSFVQSLLNDIRERLIANRVPLQAVQFVLFSKDYENLQFIADQSVRGMKNYVVQFTYPPGMQPFEMPAGRGMGPLGGAPQSQGQGVPEDDENDRFIILKKAVFDLDGVLTEYQVTFPEKAQTEKVEDLLNTAEFQPVNNPRAVIPSFKSNNKIKCECGEPLELAEMKSVVTESPKFEAYFVIGKKCKCGRNPFVLFNSPGNKEIPSDLKPLFE